MSQALVITVALASLGWAPPAAPSQPGVDLPRLGSLSEREESGGRGPGVVSTGKGDAGGVSYGTYQMTSLGPKGQIGGTVATFVAKHYRTEFAGLTPGSVEFSAQWKKLAAEHPDEFRDAQHQFIRETHYDPLVNRLKSLGLDVNLRSRALQNVVWSTAVQHGPRSQIVPSALTGLARTGEAVTDEELIRGIYAERGRTDEQGIPVHFRKNSEQVQRSVLARFRREQAEALRQLDEERKSAAARPSKNVDSAPLTPGTSPAQPDAERLTRLRAKVNELVKRVAAIERELDELMNSDIGAGDLAAEARLEAAVGAKEAALRDAKRELAAAEKELRQAEH